MSLRNLEKHLIFVYGTLKSGEPNNYLLKDPKNGFAESIGKGETISRYPLIIASKFNIPFLLDKPDVGNKIIGEIYEVDDEMLKVLDKLENHPTYYERRLEQVQTLANERRKLNCWIYFLRKFRPDLLELPMINDYSSNGSHGLKYVESESTTNEDEIYPK